MTEVQFNLALDAGGGECCGARPRVPDLARPALHLPAAD